MGALKEETKNFLLNMQQRCTLHAHTDTFWFFFCSVAPQTLVCGVFVCGVRWIDSGTLSRRNASSGSSSSSSSSGSSFGSRREVGSIHLGEEKVNEEKQSSTR